MFKHFINNYEFKSIITYCDIRYFKGTSYEKVGFNLSHISQPDYYYFHNLNINKLYHRSSFQKHKLKDKLEIFDKNKTEVQNMLDNGYYRIFDCGNKVFVYNA